MTPLPICDRAMLSHPSRVRGLKSCIPYGRHYRNYLSHPSRVRGLKCQSSLALMGEFLVAPFTGAWIEIGIQGDVFGYHIESHPSRVRGLKFEYRKPCLNHSYVAPFTGAWIEMRHEHALPQRHGRRTLHGCVD